MKTVLLKGIGTCIRETLERPSIPTAMGRGRKNAPFMNQKALTGDVSAS